MIFKRQVGRDSRYLEFIRSRPCSFCGHPVVDPHHALKGLRGIRAGMVQKIDYLAIPLCRPCHTKLHDSILKPDRSELLELVVINLICYLDNLFRAGNTASTSVRGNLVKPTALSGTEAQ